MPALDPRHALFPGTFDPVTYGHLDLVRRAAAMFERVTVGVARNPGKREMLTMEQRLELLRETLADRPTVTVTVLEGLVIAGCRELGTGTILRGARTSADFDFEAQMARSNRAMAPDLETIILISSPEHVHISSTLVRQVAEHSGDLTPFVPDVVARVLESR